MPLFVYNRDIPDAPNNPSVDQPDMKINTNSTDDLINVDHYSFNQANGGLHRQVQMPFLGAIPAGLGANQGTLYTKSSTGSQLFYSPDASGNEYQMTRTIAASFSEFAKNNNYVGTLFGGWTFLPGGLLLQYGSIVTPITGVTGNMTFPIAFTGVPFSITTSIVRAPFSSSQQFFYVGVVSNTGFSYSNSSAANLNIFWMAIGI